MRVADYVLEALHRRSWDTPGLITVEADQLASIVAELRDARRKLVLPETVEERVDKVVFQLLNALDSSEAWQASRRDPESLRHAVRLALGWP